MKDDTNLAYTLDWGSFELREDSAQEQSDLYDDRILDQMRTVVKEYVAAYVAQLTDEVKRMAYKKQFDDLRQRLRDSVLREYSSFEFIEKLYLQEYLMNK